MPLKGSKPSISSQWQTCLLTWYDPALGGINSSDGSSDATSTMANGQPYSETAYNCAAPTAYAFGTVIEFQYGGTSVQCTVTDRGGAITGTHFDLSRAPAAALGIVVGNTGGPGRVNGQFRVVSGSGNPAPDASGSASRTQDNGSKSVLSMSLSDLFSSPAVAIGDFIALMTLEMLKSTADGIGDYIIRPVWHLNQKAVAYYQQNILFSSNRPDAMPATAAFWGLGYVLLFTDPKSGNLKPAPVRRTRLARHVRAVQSLPAKRSLVKPKDVREKTPKKPKPVVSSTNVTRTGTMSTTRPAPVKVTGTHARVRDTDGRNATGIPSEIPIDRAGTLPREKRQTEGQAPRHAPAKPDAHNRAGRSSHAHSRGKSKDSPAPGIFGGNESRRR